jgi:hypothetical protein
MHYGHSDNMRFTLSGITLIFAALAASTASAAPAHVLVHWVQMAPGGGAEIRAIVGDEMCPAVTIDGAAIPMRERAAPDQNFPVRVCALTLPKAAKSAVLSGDALPLPKSDPVHIAVLGDTGCPSRAARFRTATIPCSGPSIRLPHPSPN